jgi:hypothetical protein
MRIFSVQPNMTIDDIKAGALNAIDRLLEDQHRKSISDLVIAGADPDVVDFLMEDATRQWATIREEIVAFLEAGGLNAAVDGTGELPKGLPLL